MLRIAIVVCNIYNPDVARPTAGYAEREVSLYMLNRDKILLTHYCAMTPDGNQVRLQTPRLGLAPEHLDFRFAGATNSCELHC